MDDFGAPMIALAMAVDYYTDEA